MADKQRQFHRRTLRMHYRGRCYQLDRVEPVAELALDLGERAPRSQDQDISPGVVIRIGDETILPRIGAEADHRDPAAERVIDLARLVPFQSRDDQTGAVQEAAAPELGS